MKSKEAPIAWVRSQDDHPGKIAAAALVPQDDPNKTIPSTQDFERLDRALSGDEVRWVNDFVINETLTNLRGYSVFRFR